MVELKYTTRKVSRIKENCTRQQVSYTRLLDILFPELAPFLGTPAAKHKAHIYAILRGFPFASKLANAHLIKNTNLISIRSLGRFGKEQALS